MLQLKTIHVISSALVLLHTIINLHTHMLYMTKAAHLRTPRLRLVLQTQKLPGFKSLR